MNKKHYVGLLTALFAGILMISVCNAAPAAKYTPVGTWEYSAPAAPEGYNLGKMVVTEKEDGYGVTIVFSEYARLDAEKVDYSKKSISFVIYVEYEEVTVTGDFNKDAFTGKVNAPSMGVFDFTATRVKTE